MMRGFLGWTAIEAMRPLTLDSQIQRAAGHQGSDPRNIAPTNLSAALQLPPER
jgi:hypothetical protein